MRLPRHRIRIEEVLLSVQNAPIIREQHQKVSATLQEVTTRIAEVQRRVPREADAGSFLKEVTQIASADKSRSRTSSQRSLMLKTATRRWQ